MTLGCASTPVTRATSNLSPAESAPSSTVVARYQAHRETPEFGRTLPGQWQAWARSHGGLQRRGSPAVGQVALFGTPGGKARWAGKVERVDRDGTALLQVLLHGQPVRLRMNLRQPGIRRHPATHRVLNHYLEDGHTTAQLWLGCVTPPGGALVADAR